jgi:hypothetical protein
MILSGAFSRGSAFFAAGFCGATFSAAIFGETKFSITALSAAFWLACTFWLA